jgi:hypothetical protein
LWQVYEFHVVKERRFDLAIDSYLSDPLRKLDLIPSLSRWLTDIELNENDKFLIRSYFLEKITDIISDGVSVPEFVDKYFDGIHLEIIKKLKRFPEKKIAYLTDLLYHPNDMDIKVPKYGIDLYHQYVDLMSRMNPLSVRPFLEHCDRTLITAPYNLDYVLNLCRQNEINDGVIWILIQKKNFENALPLIIIEISSSISAKHNQFSNTHIQKLLNDAYLICEKDKSFWVELLTKICFKINPLNDDSKKIQNDMIEKVSQALGIPEMLFHLLQSEQTRTIGQNRSLLNHMLVSLSHQKNTNDFAAKFAGRHLYSQFKEFSEYSKSSFYTPLGQCQICRRLLHVRAMTREQQKESLIMFKCKHAYHLECLKETIEKIQKRVGIPGSVEDYESWCVVCGNPSKKKRKGKATQLLVSLVFNTNIA